MRRRTGSIKSIFHQTQRATKSVIYAMALYLFITGCQQQAENDGSTITSEPDLETTDADLLDGGFYSTEAIKQEKTDEAIPETNDTSPAISQTSPQQDAIVAESEFSAVEETAVSESAVQEPFCITHDHSKTVDTDIGPDEACKQISNRLASISYAACASAKLVHSQCESVSGFPILFREFPPIGDKAPQGRILVIGGTHGDELTSVSITFKWIEKLNKYHSGLFHWHVAPMMNPDGVLNSAATRTNKNGVDLNRNMPSDDWEENALKYWVNKQEKNPRRYPGEEPASEPETQWLIDEINTFKPDAIISVHAPFGVVDFDALVLKTAPKNLGKLTLNLLGTYPGSLGNYAGINRDIPVITLELPHAWVMPSDQETTKIWEDIVSWLRKNVGTEQLADASEQSSER